MDTFAAGDFERWRIVDVEVGWANEIRLIGLWIHRSAANAPDRHGPVAKERVEVENMLVGFEDTTHYWCRGLDTGHFGILYVAIPGVDAGRFVCLAASFVFDSWVGDVITLGGKCVEVI